MPTYLSVVLSATLGSAQKFNRPICTESYDRWSRNGKGRQIVDMARISVDFNMANLRDIVSRCPESGRDICSGREFAVHSQRSADGSAMNVTRIEKLEVWINVDLAFGLYRDRAFAGTGIIDDYVPLEQKSDGFSVPGR